MTRTYLKDNLVSLRALEPEDIDLLYSWENSEENWTVSNTIAPYSKHILALYIQNSDKDLYESRQLRLMIDTVQGETVGAIDLFDFDPFNSRAGIGILVHSPEDRSKGYATAALALMTDYCFEKLALHQVYANILSGNENSIRLFSKAGFVMAGTMKEWVREGACWLDENIFQLVRKSDEL